MRCLQPVVAKRESKTGDGCHPSVALNNPGLAPAATVQWLCELAASRSASLRQVAIAREGWRFGLMRLYAEMACARPANVGPSFASQICSTSTIRRLFNSQAAQQSRLEEEGRSSVNKLATACGTRPSQRALALQIGALLFPPFCFGGQCTGSTSRVNMGTIEQCPKGSIRCGRRQGRHCAVLMAWIGRHNSNAARTHSQTSREFNYLTVTARFPMWPVSTPAARSKLAVRQCNRKLPALPAAKNKRSAPMPASSASAWDCSDLSSPACSGLFAGCAENRRLLPPTSTKVVSLP